MRYRNPIAFFAAQEGLQSANIDKSGYHSDDMIQRRQSLFSTVSVLSDTTTGSPCRTDDDEEDSEQSQDDKQRSKADEADLPVTCRLPRHLTIKHQSSYRFVTKSFVVLVSYSLL